MKRQSFNKKFKTLGAPISAAFLLAACGSAPSATGTTTSTASKVQGGVVNFAEGPGAAPNYIFPLTPGTNFSTSNLSFFQVLMYRPLYWFGNGTKAEINYSLSLAQPPIYTNGGKTVTINMNPNYKWSNGESVDAQDVIFWMNLLKANKANWGGYVPGAFPDNVLSYKATSKYQVVLTLDSSYNTTWFTYNELSQITPLPLAWDRTSLSAPAPTSATPVSSLPDQTPAGAVSVYNFLNTQAGDLSTYATSPIWSVVDGPWKLQSFTIQGKASFVPNPTYGGPVKPSISSFNELPFTSNATEFNVLTSGALQYGYLPVSDISQQARLASQGYTTSPWKLFGFDFWVENFNNPVLGPVFRQLYFRQALQHLVDQSQWIKSFLHGLAVPTYSPVPTGVANPFADTLSKTGMYGFSVAQAKALLTSHGWKVVPNGVSTCATPGTGANECGPGVAAGTPLSFPLLFASGSSSLAQEMQAYKSAAAEVGIQISLSEAPFSQVISSKAPCSGPTCTWGMVNWGGGWSYGPDYSPTGGELFSSGVRVGFSKVVPETVTLIDATHTAPPAQSQAALDAYQNFMVKEAPVVYQPYPPFQTSEINSKLKGVAQSPYGNLTPEDWYFVK